MRAFSTLPLPSEPIVMAPDGSDVRMLLGLSGGGLAHFELAAGTPSSMMLAAVAEVGPC